MLRIYCALSGTSRLSAFSTARTEAMAWTVVQTPQIRWVKIQASRGSRSLRMISMPRHIWPDDHALVTLPSSTSQSMRRCPSMRVIGSMVMRVKGGLLLAMRGIAVQHRQGLDEDEVEQDLERDDADRHHQLGDGREVGPVADRLVTDQIGIETIERAAGEQREGGDEGSARTGAPGRHDEHQRGDDEQGVLDPEHEHLDAAGEGERNGVARDQIAPA